MTHCTHIVVETGITSKYSSALVQPQLTSHKHNTQDLFLYILRELLGNFKHNKKLTTFKGKL